MSTVELFDDHGTGAVCADFFRSREFYTAEGVTHTLVLGTATGRVTLPLVVRAIPDRPDLCDATSPYGYPGGILEGAPIDPRELDFSGTNLVSLFVRGRIGTTLFENGTLRPPVYRFQPDQDHAVGATFLKHVRRNERRGLTIDVVPGAEVDPRTVEEFDEVYLQTMKRTGARSRYLFSVAYLRHCLNVENTWLFTVRTPDGELAAASIAVLSDGLLHYFLEGTDERWRSWSPGKNCVARALRLAEELGIGINFGGGLTAGDGISVFKQSFCNAEDQFRTYELVCDERAYAELTADVASASDFFPAYRRSASV